MPFFVLLSSLGILLAGKIVHAVIFKKHMLLLIERTDVVIAKAFEERYEF